MNIEEKNNKGLLALQLGNNVEAEEIFLDCLKIDDKSPQLWYNLGLTQFRQDQFEEAEECFKKAAGLGNEYTEAWAMLGTSRIEQKKFNEAQPPLGAANTPECNALIGQIDLGTGDFSCGFADFEDRFQNKPENTWDGRESLIGKTLLVEGTEGLGDQIFFARWLRRVAELGAERVYLKVSEPLEELFYGQFGRHFTITQSPPTTDYRINLGSLGFIFEDGIGTIPTVYYMRGFGYNSAIIERIGLAWSGNIMHVNDRRRSIPLPFFQPILDLPFDFTCVQKDMRAGDEDYWQYTKIEREEIENVEDLANIISGQDLIITVDTLTANLAGAMGRPTWVLVPYVCDWRWMFEGEKTPWYPSVRVFRQGADRRWEPVIEKVCEELKKLGEV